MIIRKGDFKPVLIDLIKYAPKEASEVVTDFARATLLLGWDKTKDIFADLWKFIATISFKDSLEFYYGKNIEYYLSDIILIDGTKLAKLIIEHNILVSTEKTYQIKRIDTDFFQEE